MNDIFPSRDIQLLIYMKTIIEEFCFQFYWNYKYMKTEATEVCKSLKTILPFPQELHLKILKNCLQSTPVRQHFQLQSKLYMSVVFGLAVSKLFRKVAVLNGNVIYQCHFLAFYRNHQIYLSIQTQKQPSGTQNCNFIEKETPAQMFSCEFCEMFKNIFFQNTSG